jgi:membrane protein required for colicin V production
MTFTALDYALLAVLALSSLVGLLRGFFREAMSLIVWVAALWVASRYATMLSPYLADHVVNASLRLWIARGVLVIAVLIAGGIVTWIVATALHRTGLGGTDRTVGMLFGLARGLLLAGLAIIVLRMAGFSDEPWWRQSKLIPYAAPAAEALREAAEQGFNRSSWPRSISPLPGFASGPPESPRS